MRNCIFYSFLYWLTHSSLWKLLLYLHSAFHIRYNTGLSFASIRFTPWSKRIKECWFFGRAGCVINSSTASSAFCAITTAITTTGGARSRARNFLAFTWWTWRLHLLRERSRFSRTRSTARGGLPDSSRMRTPGPCRNDWKHVNNIRNKKKNLTMLFN